MDASDFIISSMICYSTKVPKIATTVAFRSVDDY